MERTEVRNEEMGSYCTLQVALGPELLSLVDWRDCGEAVNWSGSAVSEAL